MKGKITEEQKRYAEAFNKIYDSIGIEDKKEAAAHVGKHLYTVHKYICGKPEHINDVSVADKLLQFFLSKIADRKKRLEKILN